MSNNIAVKDATGAAITLKSTDNSAVHLPAHQLRSSDGVNAVAIATDGSILAVPVEPGTAWVFAGATGGIINTTAVTIKAAAGASIKNYLTDLSISNPHATVATEFSIRDGASGTVIWRGHLPALNVGGRVQHTFKTPLRSTANTLLEVVCATTGASVFVNASGYTAA